MPASPATGHERSVFYISDGTGITAETFGHSLLTQFGELNLHQVRLPFVNSREKADEARIRIDSQGRLDRHRPIVFSTLVDSEINDVVRQADCRFLDLFASFVEPLEQELQIKSTHTIGRSHTVGDSQKYNQRIDAINYSLAQTTVRRTVISSRRRSSWSACRAAARPPPACISRCSTASRPRTTP